MSSAILASPLLGIVLCCAAWWAGLWLQNKTRLVLCNPLVVATALVILALRVFRIPYEAFELGGSIITLMLGPVTAVLALNIYQQRRLLGRYFLPVLAGCLAGCLASVGCILLLCRLLAVQGSVAAALFPKSVTAAIAIALSEQKGGIAGITVAAVIAAGVTGALFAPLFARIFRITDPVAQGVATGACSHALGTTRALEAGQLQGAMSSISICICGILTSVLALFLP